MGGQLWWVGSLVGLIFWCWSIVGLVGGMATRCFWLSTRGEVVWVIA